MDFCWHLAREGANVSDALESLIWDVKTNAFSLMNGLDATAQKLLQNDPNNPNSPKKPEPVARPGLGLSKSTMGGKPSLRETMLAQKKAAMASKNLPARPESAMAHFSPVRKTSNSSTTSSTSTAAAPAVRAKQESTLAVGSSGLSVAPVRPARRRPDIAPRPATAGPYSVRSHDQPSAENISPPTTRTKAVTPKVNTMGASPKRTVPRTRPGHVATMSESSVLTPTKNSAQKPTASPSGSPARPRLAPAPVLASSSPSKAHEDFTLVVPPMASLKASPPKEAATPPRLLEPVSDTPASEAPTPSRSLRVYEDPFTNDQPTPKPVFVVPVLEDKPVNADAANLVKQEDDVNAGRGPVFSPEKAKQNSRLLDSGIAKVKAKSLDVHGFRKLQGILRDNKASFTDEKFESLLLGLFEYLEAPLSDFAPEKVQDVKAQILATIKLLLKKERENFQPHVSRGLESLLATRSGYDARTHIVSGLELLADELVTLGDAQEIAAVLTKRLGGMDMDTSGSRSLSMGLHVLKEMIDSRTAFVPTDAELTNLAGLCGRCLESSESGVRMDAVQLCVALHARVGDARFWDYMKGVKEDPKSLITYYIVKRQRETATA